MTEEQVPYRVRQRCPNGPRCTSEIHPIYESVSDRQWWEHEGIRLDLDEKMRPPLNGHRVQEWWDELHRQEPEKKARLPMEGPSLLEDIKIVMNELDCTVQEALQVLVTAREFARDDAESLAQKQEIQMLKDQLAALTGLW